MSDYAVEPQADQGQTTPGLSTSPMARYTIHLRVHNDSKQEIAHVLGAVRKALTGMGFNGRTVIRRAQGDWKDYDTEEMDLVMVDALDDPQTLQQLMTIGQGAKQLGGQDAIYITKQPIETYLV